MYEIMINIETSSKTLLYRRYDRMSEDEKQCDAPKKYTAKNVEADTKGWEMFQNAEGTKQKKSDSK
jgi:hypothetical protein